MPHLVDGSGVRVASVSRAMRVLEAFVGHPEGVALSRLAATLGYGKASLSKILGTLVREGFVRQDPPTGRFHLSWRLLAMAFGHAERVGMPAICMPILQALADETDELVQLAVVEDGEVLFVAKAEGPGQQIRMMPLVGLVAPAHATASGKVWLAQLREAHARGYAIVDEELVQGGRAAAAPIVAGGRMVGAVAVSGPTFRLSLAKLHRIAPRMRRAAAELGVVWPPRVTARDFGLRVRPVTNGRPARASTP